MISFRNYLAKEAMKPVITSTLIRYRTQRNLTQEAMARKLSISLRSYIDLEHGESFPSATSLALLLTMLEQTEQEQMLEEFRKVMEEVKHPSK